MRRFSKHGLTPRRQQLLNRLIERRGLDSSPSPRIPLRANRGSAPLSFAQLRLWFINELEPSKPTYNEHFTLRLKGRVSVVSLQQCLNEIIARHEVLRTTFKLNGTETVQEVAPDLCLPICIVDVSGPGLSGPHRVALELAVSEARKPFDLERGPLMRMTVVTISGEESLLLFTIHHIVSDGWSHGIITTELASLYEAFTAGTGSVLKPLTIQYGDFAVYQRKWVAESVLAPQLSYWKEMLAGAQPTLDLPLDHPRPAAQSFNGRRELLVLRMDLCRKLKEFSKAIGSTDFVVLVAAFKALIYRYTGQNDVLIGTPVAGRNNAETESLIGLFVNTLILRTEVQGQQRFEDLHSRVKDTALSALAHQDLPFEIIAEELNPERSLKHNPLFQVLFSFQKEPAQDLRLPGFTIERLDFDAGTAKFDMALDLIDSGSQLTGAFEYNTDLFETVTIRRMAGSFLRILEEVVSHPERRVWQLSRFCPAARYKLETAWIDKEI
jgi:hypothetical protein